MAFNFNRFSAICRMTRDPEQVKTFGQRSVIRFGVAFTGERRKGSDGRWEDKSCFMDCEAWQGEFGRKIVDTIDKYGKKGLNIFIEGSLKMEEWSDKNTGDKRKAIKIVVTEFLLLEKTEAREDAGGYGGESSGDSGGGGYGDTSDSSNDPIPF
jgi:single-strand DNA-binding protein